MTASKRQGIAGTVIAGLITAAAILAVMFISIWALVNASCQHTAYIMGFDGMVPMVGGGCYMRINGKWVPYDKIVYVLGQQKYEN